MNADTSSLLGKEFSCGSISKLTRKRLPPVPGSMSAASTRAVAFAPSSLETCATIAQVKSLQAQRGSLNSTGSQSFQRASLGDYLNWTSKLSFFHLKDPPKILQRRKAQEVE